MERRNTLLAMLAAVVVSLGITTDVASAGVDHPQVSGLTSAALLSAIGNDDAFAMASDLSPYLDPAGTGNTQHYGSYPSTSPDSGTCGNDWADDTFDRDFTVHANGDGTFTIVEQFKNGTFVTKDGLSPGSCDESDGTPPGFLSGGLAGTMHGYFIISDVGTQTSTSPFCNATLGTNNGCDTATFLNTHFTCGTGCTVTTFLFHYAGYDGANQALVEHEWKNASCDRGGNSGDIATTNVLVTPPFLISTCP